MDFVLRFALLSSFDEWFSSLKKQKEKGKGDQIHGDAWIFIWTH